MTTISREEFTERLERRKYSPEICLQVDIATAAENLLELTGCMKILAWLECDLDKGASAYRRRQIIKEMRRHIGLCQEALATYEAAPDRAVEGPLP